jgi:hypothetical protein
MPKQVGAQPSSCERAHEHVRVQEDPHET